MYLNKSIDWIIASTDRKLSVWRTVIGHNIEDLKLSELSN